MVHHGDPYVRLGPFKMELLMTDPLRSVFHDILTEEEMAYLVSYATPRLSNTRIVPISNLSVSKQDLKSGKRGRTVSKTNQVQAFKSAKGALNILHQYIHQVWMEEKKWHEEQMYVQTGDNPLMYQAKDLKDPYGHTVIDPLLIKLSKKVEMATAFNVTARFASSQYQVGPVKNVTELIE